MWHVINLEECLAHSKQMLIVSHVVCTYLYADPPYYIVSSLRICILSAWNIREYGMV